jgi:hypothetical protein
VNGFLAARARREWRLLSAVEHPDWWGQPVPGLADV